MRDVLGLRCKTQSDLPGHFVRLRVYSFPFLHSAHSLCPHILGAVGILGAYCLAFLADIPTVTYKMTRDGCYFSEYLPLPLIMSLPPRCRTLIFDLGDVLFSWSPVTSTSISPKVLKQFLSSTVWQEYECGRLSEDECYRLVGEKFSLDPGEVRQAIHDARASLQPDDTFIRFIRELQSEANGALRIFAMSNISGPDYVVARGKPTDWSIFERVFTSADAGMRKPDLGFYKYVLGEIKAEPSSVVFVDDRFENVLAARSLGINGIVFDDVDRVRQALWNFVGDPVSRGKAFLENRAGRLESETNLGGDISENFTQLLILEATRNE